MILEFEDGLCTPRLMIEAVRYKFKDIDRRTFDLYYSYRIVKWRRNKLKLYAIIWDLVKDLFVIEILKNCKLIVKSSKWGILCSVTLADKVSNTSLRLGQWCNSWGSNQGTSIVGWKQILKRYKIGKFIHNLELTMVIVVLRFKASFQWRRWI